MNTGMRTPLPVPAFRSSRCTPMIHPPQALRWLRCSSSLRTPSVGRGCHTLILTPPHYRDRSQALDSSIQHRQAVHVPQNRYTWSEWACGCVGVEGGGTQRKTRAGSNSLPLLRFLGLNADGELGLGRYTRCSRWDWSWRLPGSVVPNFFRLLDLFENNIISYNSFIITVIYWTIMMSPTPCTIHMWSHLILISWF